MLTEVLFSNLYEYKSKIYDIRVFDFYSDSVVTIFLTAFVFMEVVTHGRIYFG